MHPLFAPFKEPIKKAKATSYPLARCTPWGLKEVGERNWVGIKDLFVYFSCFINSQGQAVFVVSLSPLGVLVWRERNGAKEILFLLLRP